MTLEGYTSNRPDPNNIPANIKQGEYIYGVGPGTYQGSGINRAVNNLSYPGEMLNDSSITHACSTYNDNYVCFLGFNGYNTWYITRIARTGDIEVLQANTPGPTSSVGNYGCYKDGDIIHINGTFERLDYDINAGTFNHQYSGNTTGILLSATDIDVDGITFSVNYIDWGAKCTPFVNITPTP